jgi:hypothetical protein
LLINVAEFFRIKKLNTCKENENASCQIQFPEHRNVCLTITGNMTEPERAHV